MKLEKEIEKIIVGEDLTLRFEDKINKTKKEIDMLNIDREKEEKIIWKLKEEKEKIREDIKKDLDGFVSFK